MTKQQIMLWLISRLGHEVRRGSSVNEATWERTEELRVDRLGPTDDDLVASDPSWKPPPGLVRPSRTLGRF
jgi:hypothetical protein